MIPTTPSAPVSSSETLRAAIRAIPLPAPDYLAGSKSLHSTKQMRALLEAAAALVPQAPAAEPAPRWKLRGALLSAVLNGPHEVSVGKVVIRRSDTVGPAALTELGDRLMFAAEPFLATPPASAAEPAPEAAEKP